MRWSGEKVIKHTNIRGDTLVNVCAFRVMDEYVLFSLYRTDDDTLVFPRVVFEQAVDTIGRGLEPNLVGSTMCDGEIFVFFQCGTPVKNDAVFLTKSDRQWWTLSSEIVNWQRALHFPVVESVVNLFLTNPDMLFVENVSGDKYECPAVGYCGSYYAKIHNLSLIGVPRSESESSSLGPHFYFGDYADGMRGAFMAIPSEYDVFHAGENIVQNDGRFTRGGIARFALKLGKMHTVLLGRHRDRSKRTLQGVKNGSVRSSDVPFRDPDGKWAESFDAVILGRRSSGRDKMLHPQYVVKKFYQHIPLSYHYVDTVNNKNADAATIE